MGVHYILELLIIYRDMQWYIWLRHCATSWKVTILIPDSVTGICKVLFYVLVIKNMLVLFLLLGISIAELIGFSGLYTHWPQFLSYLAHYEIRIVM
jgi:hypothetical protein